MQRVTVSVWVLRAAWLSLWCCLLPQATLAQEGPIRVGVSVSLTGKYEQPGRAALEGLQMWVDDVNTRGALLGRKVGLVYYDDQSSAEKSTAQGKL